MKSLKIFRQEESPAGTFGIMDLSGIRLKTGELPWKNNQHDISRIPSGRYFARPSWMPHFKREMYLLQGVKNRDSVFIHPGNFVGDTSLGLKADVLGCITLGHAIGMLAGQKSILSSYDAVMQFMNYMDGEDLELEIFDCEV